MTLSEYLRNCYSADGCCNPSTIYQYQHAVEFDQQLVRRAATGLRLVA